MRTTNHNPALPYECSPPPGLQKYLNKILAKLEREIAAWTKNLEEAMPLATVTDWQSHCLGRLAGLKKALALLKRK